MAAEAEQGIDIGRVIARGIDALARNLLPFLAVTLPLVGVPVFLLQYLMVGADIEDPRLLFKPLYWLSVGLDMVIGYVLAAILVRSSILHLSGRPPDLGGSIGLTVRLLPPILGVGILSALVIFAGTILLIVPGLILYAMLIVAVPALIQERTGVVGSLRRSRELTRGSRGRIMLLIVALTMLWIAVGIAAELLAGFFSAPDDPEVWMIALIDAATATFSALVTAPLVAALYVELRTVKEGATAEDLADIFA